MKSTITVFMLYLIPASSYASAVYRNKIYGFAVDIPTALVSCEALAPNPNHGVTIPLEPGSCEGATDRDRLVVWGEYNVPYEAVTTLQLSKHFCEKSNINRYRVKGIKASLLWCKVNYGPNYSARLYFVLMPKKTSTPETWIVYNLMTIQTQKSSRKTLDLALTIIDTFRSIPVEP